MRTISNLFARSPFTPLQTHMSHVIACARKVKELIEVFLDGDMEQTEKLSEEISKLEHAADLAKNDIRKNLPKGLFLPVDRGNLLEILTIQDSIADKCEDIGILLSLRSFSFPKKMYGDFKKFLEKNLEAVEMAYKIIQQLDELLESSFSGEEAKRVGEMIYQVAVTEHEADILQRKLLKSTLKSEDKMGHATFFQMIRTFESISDLSNYAEKLANRVRLTLDIK